MFRTSILCRGNYYMLFIVFIVYTTLHFMLTQVCLLKKPTCYYRVEADINNCLMKMYTQQSLKCIDTRHIFAAISNVLSN